jgi:intracellular multiplication protein IcmM
MPRLVWDLKKKSKNFYMLLFRRAKNMTIIFLFINILLEAALFVVYLNIPERYFYATYGDIPPIQLIPMDEPNYSPFPLLANDDYQDSDARSVPQ